MLKSISLRNFVKFKEYNHLDFSNDSPFILIGENDTGKSAVLEGVRRCLKPELSTNVSFVPKPDELSYFICYFENFEGENVLSGIVVIPDKLEDAILDSSGNYNSDEHDDENLLGTRFLDQDSADVEQQEPLTKSGENPKVESNQIHQNDIIENATNRQSNDCTDRDKVPSDFGAGPSVLKKENAESSDNNRTADCKTEPNFADVKRNEPVPSSVECQEDQTNEMHATTGYKTSKNDQDSADVEQQEPLTKSGENPKVESNQIHQNDIIENATNRQSNDCTDRDKVPSDFGAGPSVLKKENAESSDNNRTADCKTEPNSADVKRNEPVPSSVECQEDQTNEMHATTGYKTSKNGKNKYYYKFIAKFSKTATEVSLFVAQRRHNGECQFPSWMTIPTIGNFIKEFEKKSLQNQDAFISNYLTKIFKPQKISDKAMSQESKKTAEKLLKSLTAKVVFTFPLHSIGPLQWSESENFCPERRADNYSDAEKRCEVIRYSFLDGNGKEINKKRESKYFKEITRKENDFFLFDEKTKKVTTPKGTDGILKIPEGIYEAKIISILLSSKRFQTIILEEPDRGMHPQFVNRMLQVIEESKCEIKQIMEESKEEMMHVIDQSKEKMFEIIEQRKNVMMQISEQNNEEMVQEIENIKDELMKVKKGMENEMIRVTKQIQEEIVEVTEQGRQEEMDELKQFEETIMQVIKERNEKIMQVIEQSKEKMIQEIARSKEKMMQEIEQRKKEMIQEIDQTKYEMMRVIAQSKSDMVQVIKQSKKDKRVILTTHNKALITPWSFPKCFVFKSVANTGKDAYSRIFPAKTVVGAPTQESFRMQKLRKLTTDHVSDIFFARKILFYEGESERLFLTELQRQILRGEHANKKLLEIDNLKKSFSELTLVEMNGESLRAFCHETCKNLEMEHLVLLDRQKGNKDNKGKDAEEKDIKDVNGENININMNEDDESKDMNKSQTIVEKHIEKDSETNKVDDAQDEDEKKETRKKELKEGNFIWKAGEIEDMVLEIIPEGSEWYKKLIEQNVTLKKKPEHKKKRPRDEKLFLKTNVTPQNVTSVLQIIIEQCTEKDDLYELIKELCKDKQSS